VNVNHWLSQPWFQLLCFILFAGITARGLATGSSSLLYRTYYKRAENPGLYWAAIALNGLVAAAALGLLIDGFMRRSVSRKSAPEAAMPGMAERMPHKGER